jgi:hypothetical protein
MSKEEVRVATYTILPASREVITAEFTQAQELLEVLASWEITTAEDEEQAGLILQETHERHKALEAKRKEAVAPAVAAQKEINDLFRAAVKAWSDAKQTTKHLLNEAAARREEANRAKLAEAARGNAAALQDVEPVRPPAGAAYRDEIKINILDEDLIPREYLSIDWSALKRDARKGLPAPPGVEYIRQTTVRAK